ncbi:MAG: hypothetical protein HQ591_05930 [candidate division Zixibacteria bacterium]|nr:hypothetical protein [Candidatus Tariuqbacter arcticus]
MSIKRIIIPLLMLALASNSFAGSFSLFHWEDSPQYRQFVTVSGGYTFPSGNQDWWSSLKIRTNLDEGDFAAPAFRFAYWMCDDSRRNFYALSLDYSAAEKSGEYNRSFLDSLVVPIPETVDIDVNQTIVSLNLSLAHRSFHYSVLEILTGLGGGLSWWKLGIAEHKHDSGYEVSEYEYNTDVNIDPNFYIFLTAILYKDVFIDARYTYLRTEEKMWDNELSFDNFNLSLGLTIFKF